MGNAGLSAMRVGSRRLSLGTWVSVAAVVAIGVGANLSALTVLYNIFQGSQPFASPERLAVLENRGAYHLGIPGGREFDLPGISGPDFADIESRQHAFSRVGGMTSADRIIAEGGDRLVSASRVFVTRGFMQTIAARQISGRVFDEFDFASGAPAVALVNESLWRKALEADSNVIGRVVRANGQAYSVVGVVPNDVVEFLRQREGLFDDDQNLPCVILPLTANIGGQEAQSFAARSENRDVPLLTVVARLKPGETLSGAQNELAAIADRLSREHPETNGGRHVVAVRLSLWRYPQLSELGPMLLAVAVLTLLVACASAVNLLVADGVRRGPEMAIRWALGATPGQLSRLIFGRTLLWTFPAAILAFVFAAVTLIWMDVSGAPGRSATLRLSVGPQLLAAAVGLTVIAGLALGLVARSTVRFGRVVSDLAEAGRSTSTGRRR